MNHLSRPLALILFSHSLIGPVAGETLVQTGPTSGDDGTAGGDDVYVSGTPSLYSGSGPWDVGGTLSVGRFDGGVGYLLVQDGGSILNTTSSAIAVFAGSTGTATVTGSGSTWAHSREIYVGSSGNGTLNILAGGTVNNTFSRVGNSPGSVGSVTVSGTGSLWNNSSNLLLGSASSGSLRIEAGGEVRNFTGQIGNVATGNGSAVVTGSGSVWNNSSQFFVGVSGRGELRVEAGGTVNSNNGYIGSSSGSNGTATIAGSGSLWANSSNLIIGGSALSGGGGSYGSGRLTIGQGLAGDGSDNGGVVTAALTTKVWNRGGNDSLTIRHGGRLETNILDLSDNNAHTIVTIDLGGVVGAQAVIGSLEHDGEFRAFRSGAIGGALITENYSQGLHGVLALEMASVSSFDSLFVSGDLDFSGTLKLASLGLDLTTLSYGQQFDVLNWGGSATFGDLDFDLIDLSSQGLEWDTSGFTTNGSLMIIPEPGSAALLALGVPALLRRRRRA
ncbi:hypothetical protein [Luteolibacter marinus]|uniref:hypothetical protein n=1 Tax=Luteolibacter marinus TaxID=2776705 RepID=UPI00186600A3|nr:hypothetical protein [Luteolibacter marinus]